MYKILVTEVNHLTDKKSEWIYRNTYKTTQAAEKAAYAFNYTCKPYDNTAKYSRSTCIIKEFSHV
ncbi:hypothetical protein DTG28_00145 [Salmonella enterica subsp. salamae]|nr:hypothetical protein [Salmonella enterica subsp. enterica serovar Veneziana]ECC9538249.1 hypothetical protein [Salmonella enterica subsp. salamae]ECI5144361.1 hypothetical protein [Salmonella enterica subsp. salamae]